MDREDVHAGAFVRLLFDYLKIPAGTIATVDTVSTVGSAKEFCFTVRWLNLPRGTRSRPISDRSLNLWLTDLDKFECVSKEEAEGILATRQPHRKKRLPLWLRLRENPDQLTLFEDF